MTLILVVEDDAPLRRAIARRLRDAGHRVVEAFDGRDALNKLCTAISLVVCDVEMPHKTGVELSCAVRDRFPKTPIILMSSADEPEGHKADTFLPKKHLENGSLERAVNALLNADDKSG